MKENILYVTKAKTNIRYGGENIYIKYTNHRTLIRLYGGHNILVSDIDVPILIKHIWHISKVNGGKNYAKTILPDRKSLLMHRYILGAKKGEYVDHKDGVGTNNTRSNIRICSQTQNQQNSKKNKKGTSIYKGVCWHKLENKWRSSITINGQRKHIGCFKSETEAAIAYNTAAQKHFGQFAKLNEVNI